MSNYLHHYVAVRLDMPRGKMLVHATHAAGESFYQFRLSSSDPQEHRLIKPGAAGSDPASGSINISATRAVVLGTKDEAELLALERKLQIAAVPHVAIREISDDIFNGQLVSIGAVPFLRTPELRNLFSHLRLVL